MGGLSGEFVVVFHTKAKSLCLNRNNTFRITRGIHLFPKCFPHVSESILGYMARKCREFLELFLEKFPED
jgi:hypothetical protein